MRSIRLSLGLRLDSYCCRVSDYEVYEESVYIVSSDSEYAFVITFRTWETDLVGSIFLLAPSTFDLEFSNVLLFEPSNFGIGALFC